MKKAITLRLCIVIIISMMVTAFLSCYIQIKSAKEAMYVNSMIRISQISQVLDNNSEDVERLKENLKEDYFIRAKAAAYIVQNHPEVTGDQEEMSKIAALLQVDEFHLFDTKGTLYAGTEPKYFNYTFRSGEQMQFFLPMLDDYSLQLCQDITPNTAEGKLMQYIAVWREDRQGIVQIGMEPVRLLEAMKKNELSYIFTMVTAEKGITAFAADTRTGEILGSTDDSLTGKNVAGMGLILPDEKQRDKGFAAELKIEGDKHYCVFRQSGDVLLCISSTYENLYRNIPSNMKIVIFSLCLLSAAVIFLILRMLDRFIIHGIYGIIGGMKKIAGGDLDVRVNETSSPEFAELGSNINQMVESLLEMTGKLSLVFQNVDIPVAVYEYSQDMKRVLATSKIGEILMMTEEDMQKVLADRDAFAEMIGGIVACPLGDEKDVYQLGGDKPRYLKIKSYQEKRSTLGIIVDATEDVLEKKKIELERDIDLLTGLTTRRAFFKKMDCLFRQPEVLKTAVILMADLDNLKSVNDGWGHEYGDQILKKAAELLKGCEAPNKIAARLSGDEFILVIYGADSQEELFEYIKRMYDNIMHAKVCMPGGKTVEVRLSGGYVCYPEVTAGYRELIRFADSAMYRVKKKSKGSFEKYVPEDEQPT
ncbi:diguanylate cyclase [Clostridium sp. AM58-1XD]|uniref:diguanylate cyclase n=1 Tax=Clostridium sp. AM58-1XD TaxID=2292307 RepID=UPI0015F5B661|nr:diguanylate cyclase [Clostridium sp. AM58-1XD]